MKDAHDITFVTKICERCGNGFNCLEIATMIVCYECNRLDYEILNHKLKEIMKRNLKVFFDALTGEP